MQVVGIVDQARAEMIETLNQEITRLETLRSVNPSVRPEEIEMLREQKRLLEVHLRGARLRLDACGKRLATKGTKSTKGIQFFLILFVLLPFVANLSLQAVVHVELDRMRGHAESRDFFHLQFDVGIDHVVAEHAALGQESAILVQVRQRFIQRRARMRNVLGFLGRTDRTGSCPSDRRDGSCSARHPVRPSSSR